MKLEKIKTIEKIQGNRTGFFYVKSCYSVRGIINTVPQNFVRSGKTHYIPILYHLSIFATLLLKIGEK